MKLIINFVMILVCLGNISGQVNEGQLGNKPSIKISDREDYSIYKQILRKDIIPKGALKLRYVYKLPFEEEIEKNEIFFKNLLNMSVDERGHIFVTDNMLRVIYEFGSDGKMLSKYAKVGQGPGEMQGPSEVFHLNNEIVICDGRMRKLMFFNRGWEYLRSLSLIKGYIPFGIDKLGNIYCRYKLEESLITILDKNGNEIKSLARPKYFGKRKIFDKSDIGENR